MLLYNNGVSLERGLQYMIRLLCSGIMIDHWMDLINVNVHDLWNAIAFVVSVV